MSRHEWMLHISDRVYRALLVVYPKEFRDTYGLQMVQIFRDLCRSEIGRAGMVGIAALWVRTEFDLLSSAFAERSGLVMRSSKMVWWGGLAALGGGFL